MKPCGFWIGLGKLLALDADPNAAPLGHAKASLETLLDLDRPAWKNGCFENSFN